MDTTNHTSTVRSLLLSFDLALHPRDIRKWRGAFIEMTNFQDALFHNHKGDTGYYYRYPLIQYRVHKQKAAIMAMEAGVDALQKVLSGNDWQIRWEDQLRDLKVEDLRMNEHLLKMSKERHSYHLDKYIPFKKEHYQKWKSLDNYVQRITYLEKILTGHLLAYASAMNWLIPERFKVEIQDIQRMQKVRNHEVDLLAFDLTYTCELHLPDAIGLGRCTSHGFGRQWRRNKKRRMTKQNVEGGMVKSIKQTY